MSAEAKAGIIVALILWLACTGAWLGHRYESNSSRADAAEANVLVQTKAIQMQADQQQAFNGIASGTVTANTSVDAKSEETVIEYRTILKREKTCDLPVPAGVSDGLLNYTYRLRASAMHGTSGGTDTAGAGATASGQLTYCQAVLWIQPLLAALEKANNQLSTIQQAEQLRQVKTK